MDGSRGLWTQARAELAGLGFTFVLDLFHALEYLWKVAYVFHAENSPEAEDFVQQRLLMLLEGKVGYVIGGLRQMLTKHRRLHKAHRETILTTIAYCESNRRAMRYDEYIAAGYPIGWAPSKVHAGTSSRTAWKAQACAGRSAVPRPCCNCAPCI